MWAVSQYQEMVFGHMLYVRQSHPMYFYNDDWVHKSFSNVILMGRPSGATSFTWSMCMGMNNKDLGGIICLIIPYIILSNKYVI